MLTLVDSLQPHAPAKPDCLQIHQWTMGNIHRLSKRRVGGSTPSRSAIQKETAMPLYETRVRTDRGEETKQVYAKDVQEAKRLFEQLYGGPRAVPYIPRVIPS